MAKAKVRRCRHCGRVILDAKTSWTTEDGDEKCDSDTEHHEPFTAKPISDLTSDLISYEEGTLNDEDTVSLFQHLIDTGMAWSLQGHYGRTAVAMIEAGYCTP